jgi:hypothetical protein
MPDSLVPPHRQWLQPSQRRDAVTAARAIYTLVSRAREHRSRFVCHVGNDKRRRVDRSTGETPGVSSHQCGRRSIIERPVCALVDSNAFRSLHGGWRRFFFVRRVPRRRSGRPELCRRAQGRLTYTRLSARGRAKENRRQDRARCRPLPVSCNVPSCNFSWVCLV